MLAHLSKRFKWDFLIIITCSLLSVLIFFVVNFKHLYILRRWRQFQPNLCKCFTACSNEGGGVLERGNYSDLSNMSWNISVKNILMLNCNLLLNCFFFMIYKLMLIKLLWENQFRVPDWSKITFLSPFTQIWFCNLFLRREIFLLMIFNGLF